jgi:hypothetical protein
MFYTVGKEEVRCEAVPDFFDSEIIHKQNWVHRPVNVCNIKTFEVSATGTSMSKEVAINLVKELIATSIVDNRKVELAFSTIDFNNLPVEEYIMPLCEDDTYLPPEEWSSIEILINEEDTYHTGMDFNHIMRNFIRDHLNTEMVKKCFSEELK